MLPDLLRERYVLQTTSARNDKEGKLNSNDPCNNTTAKRGDEFGNAGQETLPSVGEKKSLGICAKAELATLHFTVSCNYCERDCVGVIYYDTLYYVT